MAKNLYEMDSEYWQLYELLDELEDEDQIDALIERCDTLEDAIEHKIGNLIKWCRELATEAEAAKREQDRYAAIGRSACGGIARQVGTPTTPRAQVRSTGGTDLSVLRSDAAPSQWDEQTFLWCVVKGGTPPDRSNRQVAAMNGVETISEEPPGAPRTGVLLQQGQTLVIR